MAAKSTAVNQLRQFPTGPVATKSSRSYAGAWRGDRLAPGTGETGADAPLFREFNGIRPRRRRRGSNAIDPKDSLSGDTPVA
jgi:hypothetical protein